MKKEELTNELASMGSRLAAYAIDSLLAFAVVISMALVLGFAAGWMPNGLENLEAIIQNNVVWQTLSALGFASGVFIYIFMVLLFSSGVFTALCLWLTDGYTPGKWLLSIRVQKMTGEKLKFSDVLLREIFIKGLVNSASKSLLNIISFLWACFTPDHRTVQDLATRTLVVRAPREKKERY